MMNCAEETGICTYVHVCIYTCLCRGQKQKGAKLKKITPEIKLKRAK